MCKNWSPRHTTHHQSLCCVNLFSLNTADVSFICEGPAGLMSCWQRETLLFHSPELCLSSPGWEGLNREKVWAWLLCQEIEAIPVVSSGSGAQGDHKEWHPTCAYILSSVLSPRWHYCSRQTHVTTLVFSKSAKLSAAAEFSASPFFMSQTTSCS